uniref:Plasmid related DNA polymerase n=1 Tax=Rhizophagus sp. DAOM 213198 TaxID=1417302 RepID=A0A0A7BZE7_9GLOM|nr:plasmid related DNA polymerase [Rhizophagus sp. DAOM 213198]
MVIDQELDSSKVDPAKLGYLKLEHTIEEGIFPLPKVYYLRTTEGKVTKAKGYSGKLTRDNYLSLIKQQNIVGLRVNKWLISY